MVVKVHVPATARLPVFFRGASAARPRTNPGAGSKRPGHTSCSRAGKRSKKSTARSLAAGWPEPRPSSASVTWAGASLGKRDWHVRPSLLWKRQLGCVDAGDADDSRPAMPTECTLPAMDPEPSRQQPRPLQANLCQQLPSRAS